MSLGRDIHPGTYCLGIGFVGGGAHGAGEPQRGVDVLVDVGGGPAGGSKNARPGEKGETFDRSGPLAPGDL